MITINSAGLEELTLDDWDAGIACESLDLGHPNVRAVVADRPGAHGTIDETRYFGARSVALKLNVFAGTYGSRRAILDRIAPFCDPGRRSVIRYEDPTGGGTRALDVRAGDASAPLTNPTLTEMAVSWIVPAGLIYADDSKTETAQPFTEVAPGLTFDAMFPASFPSFTSSAAALLNEGTLDAHWTAELYGPFTGPALINRTTGEGLYFPGLTIAAGDYLHLDSLQRTVTVNGIATATRYGYLDFVNSTWWTLGPGETMVEFSPASSAPPASATIQWRDTFLI